MNWLHYLLQVNLYLILFYGFYHIVLRKETFFYLNRAYLLASSALAFFIPMLQFTWIREQLVSDSVYHTMKYIYDPQMYYTPTETFVQQGWTWGDMIAVVYITGVLIGIGRMGLQMAYLGNLLRGKSQKKNVNKNAFSFFNFLFVSKDMPMRDVIMRHEQVHIRQLHSADIMLFELLAIFNWFNPVIYLYKKAVRYIHEFIADEITSQWEESKEEYAMLLFHEQFGVQTVPLTNNFFNDSMLKQRIQMLMKDRSEADVQWKYLLVIPLLGTMLILASSNLRGSEMEQSLNTKWKAIVEKGGQPYGPSKTGRQVLAESGISISSATIISPALAEELQMEADSIMNGVDHQPEFNGGMPAFVDYLRANLKYPEEAQKANMEGKTYIQFVVNKDGSAEDFKVLKSAGEPLDNEALRVLKSVPKWVSGTHQGKLVRCTFVVPISFKKA
ncbi:M56 family metallopeptidase [Flectobacillus longus]|uniref:M56 family metallopeptidase n=1 Tax=Flectobacillus longus TaxID=2984207 RepID=UPI0024B75D5A|nr:M56 family metallopeptidase [Flectobacillus longus]MDI9882532.1 M56 family metallopeptidase [Flectobacillus longus]